MVYAFMADGCEEVEALAVVDLLRRAGVETRMVSVHSRAYTHGSHGIVIGNDMMLEDVHPTAEDTLFLPGGGMGTQNLKACEPLKQMLLSHAAAGGRIAAICAAPSVLGSIGLLRGKKAVCYPGFESQLEGAQCGTEPVVTDGLITTSRGMGTAVLLGLELVGLLVGKEVERELAAGIMLPEQNTVEK